MNINIIIPDDTHKKLKKEALEKNITLKELIIDKLKKWKIGL